jgi:hypothetical protein
MQAPSPLEQQVHRRHIRSEPIEVDIEALLENLSTDHEATLWSPARTTEPIYQHLLPSTPVPRQHARVYEQHSEVGRSQSDCLHHGLRARHGVADPSCAPTVVQFLQQSRDE